MRLKTFICGVAAASLLTVPAMAGNFPDTTGHWACAAIDRWNMSGIISGYSDGRFGPNDPITRGQMAVILDRLLGWTEEAENTFHDVEEEEWYAKAVLRANAAGVLSGDGGNARPEDPVTREEAAAMLNRALALSGTGAGKRFADGDQISTWAKESVDILSSLGLISGSDDGRFEPSQFITRAELLTILDRAVGNYYNQAGVYTSSSEGVVTLVRVPGVTLRELTVTGDMIILPGAEGSETILKDVVVTGKLQVSSGEEAKVLIMGKSHIDSLKVTGTDSRIQLENTVTVDSLVVEGSGSQIRGLNENQMVTVASSAEGVRINGRQVSAGSTVKAGKDVSSALDGMDVEIEAGGTASDNTTKPETSTKPEVTVNPGSTTSDWSHRDENGNVIIDFQGWIKDTLEKNN